LAHGIEVDWDNENRRHISAHQLTTKEFEEVMRNDPLDLDWDIVNGEERYRSVGLTDGGRSLLVAWTLRNGKIRAVTAFPATAATKGAFLKRLR
jgi:uncharacterized DUF497 family protein